MPRWDRDDLDDQYAEADNLDARIALHANYSTAETDLHRWLFDRYDLPDDADVFELGCGTGRLWVENAERVPSEWTLTLTDRSAGMVEESREAVAAAFRRVRGTSRVRWSSSRSRLCRVE
jgi:16S rRNA G1207 methylase RsmC